MLVTVFLLAGSASIAVRTADHSQTTRPLDNAAIANQSAGLERAVLAAKPGAELERLRSQANARNGGWMLAALLAVLALAGRPSSLFRQSPVSASPRRADCGRVRPSRAPPRPLLIPS